MQRQMVFKPSSDLGFPEDYGLTDTTIIPVTTSDKIKIEGWILSSGVPKAPLIIFFHGNLGHLGKSIFKAKQLLNQGFDVFMASYRGYGRNPGSPSEKGLTRDADAWMKWITALTSLEERPLIIYGESLGSGLAVKMAAKYPAKALVLHTPYSSLADIAKHRYPIFPVDLLMKDPFYVMDDIEKVSFPVFMIHGDADEIIPIDISKKLYQNAGEPKEYLEIRGGRHNDLYDYNIAVKIKEFIYKHL